MKIQILTDKSSWMNKYNSILFDELTLLEHSVSLISSKNELQQGDTAFFLSCFEIIPQEFLNLNNHNIVVHASDLPKGKGWSPASWQILEGKNEIPLTLFEAVKEMDAGDWYIKDTLKLDGTELIDEWQGKLSKKIVEMCIDFVNNYENAEPHKQAGEKSMYPRRTPKDSELDINKTIKEQFNLLRIVDNENYPAFFKINGKKYKIKINEV